jgi:hypothetical protein
MAAHIIACRLIYLPSTHNVDFVEREQPLPSIGFLGLGIMGTAMARNLEKLGMMLQCGTGQPASVMLWYLKVPSSVQCSQILAGAAPPLGPLRAPEQEQSFLQKPEVLHRVLLGNSNWPEFSLLTHTMVGASPSMMDHLPPFSKRQIFQ